MNKEMTDMIKYMLQIIHSNKLNNPTWPKNTKMSSTYIIYYVCCYTKYWHYWITTCLELEKHNELLHHIRNKDKDARNSKLLYLFYPSSI